MLSHPHSPLHSHRHAERGNAVLLVLVAIVLFAALSYVVAQGGMSSSISEKDVSMGTYARLTEFPVSVKDTVAKMLQTGVDISELDFDRAAKGKGAVFLHVNYQNPPLAAGAASDWGFRGVTAAHEGWFVSGIGTDEADGKDVFAYLDGLSREGCEMVRKALGLAAPPLTGAVPIDLSKPGAADAVAGANAWSFDIQKTTTPSDPQPAACVRNGNKADGEPNYIYYHVIVAK